MKRFLPIAPLATLLTLGAFVPAPARACGCFTPPDPAVPVVQAGERILFAVKNSQVTAHIQIQYAGDAKEFGWLVPLPSLPTLEIGTDELFTALVDQTRPDFQLKRTFATDCYQQYGGGTATGGGGGFGCGCADNSVSGDGSAGGGGLQMGAGDAPDLAYNPLVIQDSVGPYDYAVLKADDKSAMLDWLNQNHYFVPTGTDSVVMNYIHPGAFFLALKLHAGKSAGDIQPVVVHYNSDLAMIPIALTSVGAVPNMGIQVWVLGAARAIPRNYAHVVLNQAAINWNTGGKNYNDVVIRAVKSTPGNHAFVTEYADSTDIMRGVLDRQGRFGNPAVLAKITDVIQYLGYLRDNDFGYPFSGVLRSIIAARIAEPQELVTQGVSPSDFAATADQYLISWHERHVGQPLPVIDPVALTDEIEKRVVAQTLGPAQLFHDYEYLTRLYTTLSPADMNLDPVFSQNPDLPKVSSRHTLEFRFACSGERTLTTEEGFKIQYGFSAAPPVLPAVPAALRVELLREAGPPEVITDNTEATKKLLGQTSLAPAPDPTPETTSLTVNGAAAGGCRVPAKPGRRGEWLLLGLAVLGLYRLQRRARRS